MCTLKRDLDEFETECGHLVQTFDSKQAWDKRCASCPEAMTRFESLDVDPEVSYLLDLSLMAEGGYPVAPDDLDQRQWLILGIIRRKRNELALRDAVRSAFGAKPTPPEPEEPEKGKG